jgi:hypothetical protein
MVRLLSSYLAVLAIVSPLLAVPLSNGYYYIGLPSIVPGQPLRFLTFSDTTKPTFELISLDRRQQTVCFHLDMTFACRANNSTFL